MLTVGITCPAPDSLENGTIGYSSLVTTEPFSYETTATYRCDPGYDITRGNDVRTCTGDGSTPSGQWNGAAPQCPRMFYIFDHMHDTVNNSCGLWDSSVYYQWIS